MTGRRRLPATLMKMFSTFTFTSADGTELLGWTNNGDGPTVVVCNGLGVPPQAWPRLLDPHCGYRVVGWNHRGGLGSGRPADPDAIRVEDHVADALALMEHTGVERALLVAWSLGVNVSFEIAAEHPEKVAGMLMCAGVPGGTYDAAFSTLMVPKPLRKTTGLMVSRAGQAIGKPLTLLARSVPKGNTFAEILRHSGFMLPSAQTKDIVPWIQSFLEHDFEWYFRLMVAAADHEPMDPSFVQCPITVVAGGFDVMTSMRDVVAFAEKIDHAEVHVLHATHFVPLEFPDEIMAMLDGLLLRSDLTVPVEVEARAADEAETLRETLIDLREGVRQP
ncbi:MAG: alpha/beta hydrolase [Actinobacteria bacterium]|nr:alpha/beta hydrolase [Actinomycetota bacterium]